MNPITLQNASPRSDLLRQFERVLNKALQNTLDTITDKLTWEIREVGHRTFILEQRVDELDIITNNH